MFVGLLFALAACFLWGTIFVVPQLLPEFSSMEVALGRYFNYGVLSSIIFFAGGKSLKKYPLKVWITALSFGLVANVIYYFGVVIGLRFATAPLTILIVGLCPVLTALYGNLQTKEFSYRTLTFPIFCILLGILLVNLSEVDWSFQDSSLGNYLIGLIGAAVSLLTWTWFAVKNAQFLKTSPVSRSEWSTLLGLATFVWVILAGAILALTTESVNLAKFTHFSSESTRFFALTAFLGVACSWFGCYFWNMASSKLPVSILGSFIIFEMLFGLIFVFLYEMRLPSLLEFSGMLSMIVGIYLSIQMMRQKSLKEVSSH